MDASSSSPVMALAHLASGALAAGLATMSTKPLNNAVVRSQLSRVLLKEGHPLSLSAGAGPGDGHEDDSIAALPSVRHMLREADVGRRSVEAGVFFAVYALLKGARADVYGRGFGGSVPALEELGLGLLSGAVSRGVGVGISNVVFNPHSSSSSSPSSRRVNKGPGLLKGGISLRKLRAKHVLASIDEALSGVLFRGYFSTGGFVRGTVEPGITLAIEQVLARVLLGERKHGILDVFVLAVVGKVIATLATYPFRIARARMVVARSEGAAAGLGFGDDSSGGGTANGSGHGVGRKHHSSSRSTAIEDERPIELSDNENAAPGEARYVPRAAGKPKYASVFEAMRHVHRTEGIMALYDGVGSEMLRAVVHHAILMVGKELIHRFILRAALAVAAFWKNRTVMVGAPAKMATSADGTVGMMKSRASSVPTVPKMPASPMRPVTLLDKAATQQPPPPPALPRIRSLHTGQNLPLPGEKPWIVQQQAPTVRLASLVAEESDTSKVMREKPWNMHQGVGDRLGGPKDAAPDPKWTGLLPNPSWRKKPADDDTSSLVSNLLGDGSPRV